MPIKKNPVGRPKVDDKDKKQSYTVSLTSDRFKAIVSKYGSLTKAMEGIPL